MDVPEPGPSDPDPWGRPVSGSPPPAGTPGPAYGSAYGEPRPVLRNGMGTAALVLGLLGLLLGVLLIGGLLGALAVVFGAIGLSRARRGRASNGWAALTGIITGALGMIIAIVLVVTVVRVYGPTFNAYFRCLQGAQGDPTTVQACVTQFQRQIHR